MLSLTMLVKGATGARGKHMQWWLDRKHSMHCIANTCVLRVMTQNLVEVTILAWWRHQMETFSVLLAICAGNSPVTGEFPSQRPMTRSFDVFFDLCLNKNMSKQSAGCWPCYTCLHNETMCRDSDGVIHWVIYTELIGSQQVCFVV